LFEVDHTPSLIGEKKKKRGGEEKKRRGFFSDKNRERKEATRKALHFALPLNLAARRGEGHLMDSKRKKKPGRGRRHALRSRRGGRQILIFPRRRRRVGADRGDWRSLFYYGGERGKEAEKIFKCGSKKKCRTVSSLHDHLHGKERKRREDLLLAKEEGKATSILEEEKKKGKLFD